MATYDELVTANAQIRAVLDAGAEERLRAIPGVHHVTVGLKVRNRIPSHELCIRVYVREKKPDAALSPAERIPRHIDGVPTDVNVVSGFRFHADTRRVRPLKGGILISNDVIGPNEAGTSGVMEEGTFGCTATLLRDQSPVLLSNWHVLMGNGARVGEPIYQPSPLWMPNYPVDQLPKRRIPDDDVIAYITDYKITERIDAAIARLDVSSCCRCCGLDFRDEILGLSEDGRPATNTIAGLRPAVSGHTVFKVGVTTGRTEGRILEIESPELPPGRANGQTLIFSGQITIVTDDTEVPFSDHGDSGAVVIDEDNYVIGLLFGGNGQEPPDHETYANHMGEVITALGIDINYTPPHHSAGPRMQVPRTTFDGVPTHAGRELYAAARARLLANPAGAWLFALGEAHREEIVRLVTTCRPVTVTWHRAGGPALFAKGIETLRAGGEALPAPHGGGTLEDALARVGNALGTHGSAALREAIASHRETLLGSVRNSATVDDVLGKLASGMATVTPARSNV